MSDETVAGEETNADAGSEDADPVQTDPDDQAAHLPPTRSTRSRPSALDLARAFE
jgi:hypothetical protein